MGEVTGLPRDLQTNFTRNLCGMRSTDP